MMNGKTKKCLHCGLKETEEGFDPCFGKMIPGAIGACCGHGEKGYIAWNHLYIEFSTDEIRRFVEDTDGLRAFKINDFYRG